MTREEFKEFIENGEGKAYLSELGLNKFTRESIQDFLERDNEGKSLLFSLNDKEYNRRFEKFKKEGELDKLVEKMYQEKNPQMTETEKKLRDLQLENENFKKKEIRFNNLKELKKLNEEFNLPEDVFELLVNEDLENSQVKIKDVGTKYKTHFDKILENKVNERLGTAPKPQGETKANIDTELESFTKALGL